MLIVSMGEVEGKTVCWLWEWVRLKGRLCMLIVSMGGAEVKTVYRYVDCQYGWGWREDCVCWLWEWVRLKERLCMLIVRMGGAERKTVYVDCERGWGWREDCVCWCLETVENCVSYFLIHKTEYTGLSKDCVFYLYTKTSIVMSVHSALYIRTSNKGNHRLSCTIHRSTVHSGSSKNELNSKL